MVVVNRLQNVEPTPRYRRLEDIEISKLQEYGFLPKGKRQLTGARVIDIPIINVPDSYLHLKFIPDALIYAVETAGIPISLPDPTYVFTGLEHVNLLGFAEVRKTALSADVVDRTLQRLFVDIHDWFIRNVTEHGPDWFASSNASWENFFILFRWSENIRLSYTFLAEEWDDNNDFKSDSYYYDYLKVFFFLLQNCGRDDSYWNMDAEEETYKLFADRYGWEKEFS